MPSGSEFPRWPIEAVAVLVARPNELPFSLKTIELLKATDADYFGDIVGVKEPLLHRLFNFDQDTISELSTFLAALDLRFGMEIPGWSNARADQVRKIIEKNLPYDIALNSLIKTTRIKNEVPPNSLGCTDIENKLDSKQGCFSFSETRDVAASRTDIPEAATDEYDFTKWPIETLALLVSYPKELPLSVRAVNCLYNTGKKYFGEVVLEKKEELYRIQNLGHKTATEISELVSEFGLSFAMDIPGWSMERADALRNSIISRLPQNAAITNFISKSPDTKIVLLPQSKEKQAAREEKQVLREFDEWPIEQKVLLVATPSELLLPSRVTNDFTRVGYAYLGDAVQLSYRDLLKRLGRTSARELLEFFERNGFQLGQTIPGWSKLNADNFRKDQASQLRSLIGRRNLDQFGSKIAADHVENELQGIIKSIAKERHADVGIAFWGFDGSSPKTLDAVGKIFGVTRERVRQITAGITKRLEKTHFSTPRLDQALDFISSNAPGSNEYLARGLRNSGISKIELDIESIILASQLFKKNTDLRRAVIDGVELFLSPVLDGKEELAIRILRKQTGSGGCTNVNRIAAEIGVEDSAANCLRRFLTFFPEVCWLDSENDWLSSNRPARNRLGNIILKVLAVAPEIRASELRRAVSRSHRLEFCPPVAILKQFCTTFKLADLNGDFLEAIPSQKIELSNNEKILVEAFKMKGLVLSREQLEEVCIDDYNLNAASFYMYLSFSPLITRLAKGIYSLVGSTVSPGEIEFIEQQRKSDSKTPDFGWDPNGKLWFACPLSRISIHSGTMRIPQFVANLVEGDWPITHANGPLAGSLKVKGNFLVGLRKPLYEDGAEPGDFCLLRFDMTHRKAEFQLGGDDLIDRAMENIPATVEYMD